MTFGLHSFGLQSFDLQSIAQFSALRLVESLAEGTVIAATPRSRSQRGAHGNGTDSLPNMRQGRSAWPRPTTTPFQGVKDRR